MLMQASPLSGGLSSKIPGGIGGAAVMRFTGTDTMDSLRVAGAVTADSLIPDGALGGAISVDGSLEESTPFGAKVRLELTTAKSAPSAALAGYLELLKSNEQAIGALESNIDPEILEDAEKAIAFLRGLNKDEFVFGAQVGDKTVLWRGTADKLPAGVADVVKGTDALFQTLA